MCSPIECSIFDVGLRAAILMIYLLSVKLNFSIESRYVKLQYLMKDFSVEISLSKSYSVVPISLSQEILNLKILSLAKLAPLFIKNCVMRLPNCYKIQNIDHCFTK